MTPSQLRDAAERVRPHAAGNLGNAEIRDRNALATAYLAEHPADDWQPITADWLQSAGVPQTQDRSYTVGRVDSVSVVWYPPGIADESPPQLCISLHPDLGVLTFHDNATRGDLRRLCAALRIPFPD